MNYPILAYKDIDPDNKTLALVHFSQDIPVQYIRLKNFTFVSFVGGHFDEPSIDRQVIFLAKDSNGKMRLMMLEVSPWKKIDR